MSDTDSHSEYTRIVNVIKTARDDGLLNEMKVHEISVALTKINEINVSCAEADLVLEMLHEHVLIDENGELCGDALLFASNSVFTKFMVSSLGSFWKHFHGESEFDGSGFQSHRSFELSLLIILALVETPKGVTALCASLRKSELLFTTLTVLGHNIQKDIAYQTQELALEVLCRVFIFLGKYGSADEKGMLTDALPMSLAEILREKSKGAIYLMKNLRVALNKVNADNDSISSFRISKLSIGAEDQARLLHGPTWLDLGLLSMNIELSDNDTLMRIPFQYIKQAHFATDPKTLRVVVERFPADAVSVLLTDIEKQNETLTLFVHFEASNDVSVAHEILASRLADIEASASMDRLKMHRKISVVSSKPFPPEQERLPVVSTTNADIASSPVIHQNDESTSGQFRGLLQIAGIKSKKQSLNLHDVISSSEEEEVAHVDANTRKSSRKRSTTALAPQTSSKHHLRQITPQRKIPPAKNDAGGLGTNLTFIKYSPVETASRMPSKFIKDIELRHSPITNIVPVLPLKTAIGGYGSNLSFIKFPEDISSGLTIKEYLTESEGSPQRKFRQSRHIKPSKKTATSHSRASKSSTALEFRKKPEARKPKNEIRRKPASPILRTPEASTSEVEYAPPEVDNIYSLTNPDDLNIVPFTTPPSGALSPVARSTASNKQKSSRSSGPEIQAVLGQSSTSSGNLNIVSSDREPFQTRRRGVSDDFTSADEGSLPLSLGTTSPLSPIPERHDNELKRRMVLAADNNGSDEDNIFSTIMAELATLQKERTIRKQKQQMMATAERANQQITEVLERWYDLSIENNRKAGFAVQSKLRLSNDAAELFIESLNNDMSRLSSDHSEIMEKLESLDEALAVITKEIATSWDQQRKEERLLQDSIIDSKRKVKVSLRQLAEQKEPKLKYFRPEIESVGKEIQSLRDKLQKSESSRADRFEPSRTRPPVYVHSSPVTPVTMPAAPPMLILEPVHNLQLPKLPIVSAENRSAQKLLTKIPHSQQVPESVREKENPPPFVQLAPTESRQLKARMRVGSEPSTRLESSSGPVPQRSGLKARMSTNFQGQTSFQSSWEL